MSNQIKIAVQKILATVTVTSTVLGLAGFAALTPATALAVAPADYGLHEGDAISASGSSDPDVYIVNDFGYKRLFVNPQIFNLYGNLIGWAKVKPVSPATRDAFVTSGLFRNCETGDQKVYGLDVVSEDVANLRWVNTSGAQAVADDANFFKKVFCINTAEMNLYGHGADYTSVLQVPAYSRGGTTVTNGAVSVGLSSDNPAANTLIAGQAAGDLAHFTFSGSGAVTSVVLNRVGVSADTTLSNVYLYMGSKRLTDAATVSQGKVTFSDSNGLFTVNGSANISVKADIATGTSGQTIGVQLASFNGVTSTLSGNVFTVAAAPSDFGTVAVGAPTPSANTTLDPQNDYTAWQSVVTISNHDAWLKALQLRVIGSVQAGDLRNFRLMVDGVQAGSAVAQQDANGYVVFDMTGSPVLLKTGSRTLKLVVDVVGGSSKSFIVSLRQRPDMAVVESQYGQSILVTGTFPATAPTQTLGTELQSINSGTLTITKATDSPSGDIVKDSSSAVLTRYTFTAQGESMKVENLLLQFVPTNDATLGSIRNGAVYVNGSQVGSIQNISSASAGTQFNLGSSLVVVPGTPKTVEIRGDIYDNTGTNGMSDGDTFHADIIAGSSNVQRLTSLNYVSNSAPSTGNTLTVRTGSFSGAKYTGYANQTVVAPRSQYKIGHYALTAATSEAVNVNTITIDAALLNGAASRSAGDITNMFLKVWSDTGSPVLTSSIKATVSGTASNSYSVNFTIPQNKTYQVEVYADVQSSLDSDDRVVTTMDAAGLSASSNTTVTASKVTGQTISSSTGTLTLSNSSIPANRITNGGTTASVYSFTLQPSFDDFTLDEAGFNLSSSVASSAGAVAWVSLWDGATQVGVSEPMAVTPSISLFSGLNYPVTQTGGTKTLTVKVQFANVGVGSNDSGGVVQVRLSHLKYRSSSGTVTTATKNPTSFAGNSNYVFASYPTFANVALPSTVLAPGTQTLFKTNISATGGAGIQWKRVEFTITVGANSKLSSTGFQVFENGVNISSLGEMSTASKAFSTAGAGTGTLEFRLKDGNERTIPAGGSVTLELRGSVSGTNVAGDFISTSIANPLSSTVTGPDDYVTVAARGSNLASFVWSDMSTSAHTTSTDDWNDDGLVQGLVQGQSIFQ